MGRRPASERIKEAEKKLERLKLLDERKKLDEKIRNLKRK
jgi:hypothetical protein